MQVVKSILKISGGNAEITDTYGQKSGNPETKLGVAAMLELDLRSDTQDSNGYLLPYPAAELANAGAFYLALDADYDQETIPKMLLIEGVSLHYEADRVYLRAKLPNTARIQKLRDAVAKEKSIPLICEFGGYPAEEGVDCAIFAWSFNLVIRNRVYLGEGATEPPPEPGNKEYLTAIETYAAISQPLIFEYSVDGVNWHSDLDPHVDVFQRARHGVNGVPSMAQLIPYGAIGLRGPVGFLSTVNEFNPESEEGYEENALVSFRADDKQPVCTYQAIERAEPGESPATHPEKWRVIASGQKGDKFQIITGNDAPSAALAGDFYIQNGTCDYYVKQSDGTWQHKGTLKGLAGIGINSRGAYNPEEEYAVSDAVQHNYSFWRCIEPCKGIAPPELPEILNANWCLVVAQGSAGTITIAEIRSLDPTSVPTVSETKDSTPFNRVYSIGVPRGSAGPSGSMKILSECNLLPYGSAPAVSEMSGSTANDRIYKLSIPEGKVGATGAKGDGLFFDFTDTLANRSIKHATAKKGTRFFATDKIYEEDGSYYQLWYQKLSDEHDDWSEGVRLLSGPPGNDGKDFKYEDFTPAQLESLRGFRGFPGENAAKKPDKYFTSEHVYGGSMVISGTDPIAQVEIFDEYGTGRVIPLSLAPGDKAEYAILVTETETVIQFGTGLDLTYGGRVRFAQGIGGMSMYQEYLNEGGTASYGEWKAMFHVHANFEVLRYLSERNGVLYYKGIPVCNGGTGPVDPLPDGTMYYGYIPASVANGVYRVAEITRAMLESPASSIVIAAPETLEKMSIGTVPAGALVVVAIPSDANMAASKFNGINGRAPFAEFTGAEQTGANGVAVEIDGVSYDVYGEFKLSAAELFIYIDAK